MTSIFISFFDPFTGILGTGLAILAMLIGGVSLFFGRRVYWAFVAVAGFLLGLTLGPVIMSGVDPTWQPWLTLLLALVFAILSFMMYKVMIAISGAIGLGNLALLLAQPNLPEWAVVTLTILGGIIGLVVALALFDWGLMLFSSLASASLVTSGLVSLFPASAGADWIIFLFLFVIGFTFQSIQWTRERTRKRVSSRRGDESEQSIGGKDEETDQGKDVDDRSSEKE